MIRYLGCETAREMLEAFADDELIMTDQVAVESHLRWCTTCAARVEDFRLIAASIRSMSPTTMRTPDLGRLASIQSDVLARIRAERDQSFGVWLRTLFQDMRLFWPALGATAAVLVCVIGATGVLRAASDEHPDSLAGLIQFLAHPGSDCNPLPLDTHISAPRVLNEGLALDSIPDEEAAFALATVVTREGRIANYELLQSARTGTQPRPETSHEDDVQALLNVVKRSRFEPAQALGGEPVAVNMVWLVARTTVRASARSIDSDAGWIAPEQAPQITKSTPRIAQPARLKTDTPEETPGVRHSTTA